MRHLVTIGALAAAAIAGADKPAMSAEPLTLILDSGGKGARVDGEIIKVIGAVSVIGLAAGGSLTVPTSQIRGVVVSVDGESVEGDLVDWSNGGYTIRINGRQMRLLDGELIATPASVTDPQTVKSDSRPIERPKAGRSIEGRQSRWLGLRP